MAALALWARVSLARQTQLLNSLPAVWPVASLGQKQPLHLFPEWAICFLGRWQHDQPLWPPLPTVLCSGSPRDQVGSREKQASFLAQVQCPCNADVPFRSSIEDTQILLGAHKMFSSLLNPESRNELLR